MILFRVFFLGLLISFLGTLPLSTLNMTAMQIAIERGVQSALLFSLGALMIEMVYVRLSLVAMDWVRKQQLLFKLLEWVTMLVVLALALSSFYTASQPDPTPNPLLGIAIPSVVLGFLMSAFNPVQIPFWFGWSAVLFSRKLLQSDSTQYNLYIFGIGSGTFLGNCIFIFGGQYAASRVENNQQILNWIVGGVFVLTALLQLYRILRKRNSLPEMHENNA